MKCATAMFDLHKPPFCPSFPQQPFNIFRRYLLQDLFLRFPNPKQLGRMSEQRTNFNFSGPSTIGQSIGEVGEFVPDTRPIVLRIANAREYIFIINDIIPYGHRIANNLSHKFSLGFTPRYTYLETQYILKHHSRRFLSVMTHLGIQLCI